MYKIFLHICKLILFKQLQILRRFYLGNLERLHIFTKFEQQFEKGCTEKLYNTGIISINGTLLI